MFNTLRQQLETAGIDVSKWGKGQAKTLAHLQEEIESGESVLITGRQGELLRRIMVVGATIYYIAPDGKRYYLREDRQIFKDGRERKRDLELAVSEKMRPDENPKNAIIRGIREELGIEGEIFLREMGTDEQSLLSTSYPGLRSQYIRQRFEARLNEQQFKPKGYIEEQEDKSTYFIWEEIK